MSKTCGCPIAGDLGPPPSLQDPRASLRRQLRAARGWLPPGWFIAAVYWDIESGGIDLEHRSQGDAYKQFADTDLPRDGGMADLLREASSPAPKFAAVVCEDIERSGRDMFNALKLEKELSRQGIPLFATDEPADIEGVNATTVLVRRVKQGVAEWYRLQLKEKIWKGLVEHCMDGWNIGTPPYGYAADRIPHPVPFKAAQGRTKSRLTLDPDRAPVIAQIFTWRTVDKLGGPAIAARLDADPDAYPPPNPGTGWTAQNVRVMLANPKYTGHMVYGRHRTRNGRRTPAPPDQWLWSPTPMHPAIIDRATWDAAQDVAAGHGTSRDGDELNAHPATRRFYPYRSRIRCRDCRRRMAGSTYGKPGALSTYYRCPHDPATPKHAASHPDHPRTVQAPELLLDEIVGAFFADRIFGPGRAELLAAQLPATDADAAADRDAQAARLQARIRRIETAQNSQILELEDLPADPADTAAAAMRARIRARFADLHHEREQIETQLQAWPRPPPPPPTRPCSMNSRHWATSCPACRPLSRPACSPRSAWKSCGTSPASKPPCSWRSPRTPSRPSPASPTPDKTAATTPALRPAPTTPSPCGIWATPLDGARCHIHAIPGRSATVGGLSGPASGVSGIPCHSGLSR
jgi:site-specific DNA recombinase